MLETTSLNRIQLELKAFYAERALRAALKKREKSAQKAPPNILAFSRSLGFEPDPWQEQVLFWTGKRLLLNITRQGGKSTTSSVLALYQALYHPKSLILLVSPSQRQSAELFRKVSDLIALLSEKPEMPEDNRLSCTFANKSRIVSLPSKEEKIRGFSGVNLIIEDEASRVPDDLYRAVRPMLAVSGGKLILMSTPFGKRGHFFEEWDHGEGWERVCIPATECPRISSEFLAEERASMPEFWYAQEYMCNFSEAIDAVFSYEDIHAAFDAPGVHTLFGVGESTTASVVSREIQPLFGGRP